MPRSVDELHSDQISLDTALLKSSMNGLRHHRSQPNGRHATDSKTTARRMPSVPIRPPFGMNEAKVDIPITAVFLALFIGGAAIHMTILQKNNKRSHKFLFSGLLFGFCMSRIVTSIMRIASTSLPQNLNLAIAASIFVSAGILLIFIVNLVFAQRIIRAMHPAWGWHPAFKASLTGIYVLVVLTLVMVITATVQSFFTLSTNTRRIDRDIQLYGQTYFMFISFLPIALMAIALAIPRTQRADKFGSGRLRSKITILLIASTLACFGAAYRCGTSYLTPVKNTEPLPSYYHKAAFYCINFGLEIVIVYFYAFVRVDQRFHVPNGAKGSYAVEEAEPKVYTEEETFGDDQRPEKEESGSRV